MKQAFVTDMWGVVEVCYRLFPGGVECEITYIDEAGFSTAKAFVPAGKEEIEKYNRHKLSMQALKKATQLMNDQLSALNEVIEKHYIKEELCQLT